MKKDDNHCLIINGSIEINLDFEKLSRFGYVLHSVISDIDPITQGYRFTFVDPRPINDEVIHILRIDTMFNHGSNIPSYSIKSFLIREELLEDYDPREPVECLAAVTPRNILEAAIDFSNKMIETFLINMGLHVTYVYVPECNIITDPYIEGWWN